MATFHLQIVSMDRLVFDGQVQSVSCRTIHGDLAILARHCNYCTAIGMGTCLLYTSPSPRDIEAEGRRDHEADRAFGKGFKACGGQTPPGACPDRNRRGVGR